MYIVVTLFCCENFYFEGFVYLLVFRKILVPIKKILNKRLLLIKKNHRMLLKYQIKTFTPHLKIRKNSFAKGHTKSEELTNIDIVRMLKWLYNFFRPQNRSDCSCSVSYQFAVYYTMTTIRLRIYLLKKIKNTLTHL